MTDQQLLELAAKAAGIEIPKNNLWFSYKQDYGFKWMNIDGVRIERSFNPLNNDGDALRLAVELCLDVAISKNNKHTLVCHLSSSEVTIIKHDDNPYAATRRAIVRAAAAIGKEKSE